MNVLLADDNEDIRELTALLLGRRGWDVTTASSGQEALAAAELIRFDVLVLDQDMPPGSGLEVAIARRLAGDKIPIVLWTGWAGTIDAGEAERLAVVVVNKAEVQSLATVVAGLTTPASD